MLRECWDGAYNTTTKIRLFTLHFLDVPETLGCKTACASMSIHWNLPCRNHLRFKLCQFWLFAQNLKTDSETPTKASSPPTTEDLHLKHILEPYSSMLMSHMWSWHENAPCGRDVAQLVKRRTGTPLRQVWFPGAARDFLPESTFSADSLTVSVQLPCAIACINVN